MMGESTIRLSRTLSLKKATKIRRNTIKHSSVLAVLSSSPANVVLGSSLSLMGAKQQIAHIVWHSEKCSSAYAKLNTGNKHGKERCKGAVQC
jgi:hypothetical protein